MRLWACGGARQLAPSFRDHRPTSHANLPMGVKNPMEAYQSNPSIVFPNTFQFIIAEQLAVEQGISTSGTWKTDANLKNRNSARGGATAKPRLRTATESIAAYCVHVRLCVSSTLNPRREGTRQTRTQQRTAKNCRLLYAGGKLLGGCGNPPARPVSPLSAGRGDGSPEWVRMQSDPEASGNCGRCVAKKRSKRKPAGEAAK